METSNNHAAAAREEMKTFMIFVSSEVMRRPTRGIITMLICYYSQLLAIFIKPLGVFNELNVISDTQLSVINQL